LLDEHGIDALTMRRLAARLGIEAPSLYKHLPDKAAVEAAVIATGLLDDYPWDERFDDLLEALRYSPRAKGRAPCVGAQALRAAIWEALASLTDGSADRY
jgi:AcrR family transcriptional regulator